MQRDHTWTCEPPKIDKKPALSGAPVSPSPDSSPWRAQWSRLEQFKKLSHTRVHRDPAPHREAQRCSSDKGMSGRLARMTELAGGWDSCGSPILRRSNTYSPALASMAGLEHLL